MRTRVLAILSSVCLAVIPAIASETVHLANGFDLNVLSHVAQGDSLTLKTSAGTIQIPSSQVKNIEIVPDPEAPKANVARAEQAPPPRTNLDRLSSAARAQGDAPEFNRLVRSIAIVESGLNAAALSPKGAIGLMQLMPSTAKLLGVEPHDPDQNAKGGAQLLAQLLERYHYDSVRAVAAYNAGAGAVEKYKGVPPFAETQAYVRRVLKVYAQLTAAETH